jgi:hypothetical protein
MRNRTLNPNREFCALLRKIHREILAEFLKIDPKRDWVYSLKGIEAKHHAPRLSVVDPSGRSSSDG